MSEPYIAEIVMFGGNFAPRTWAFCDGQLQSIPSNSALFSLLGTTFGGDGRTTFGLPDMRGRAAIQAGQGPGLPSYRLGQKTGTETNTMTIANMPTHNHTGTATVHCSDQTGTSQTPVDTFLAEDSSGESSYNSAPTASSFLRTAATAALTVSVANNGGNRPINNMMPFVAVNYIIALYGIYPSRS